MGEKIKLWYAEEVRKRIESLEEQLRKATKSDLEADFKIKTINTLRIRIDECKKFLMKFEAAEKELNDKWNAVDAEKEVE